MKHAKLLDCTLRDGAYLIDKKFGNENITGIINGLKKAHIDFIEIGFFQNEGFGEGKTVFRNSQDAKRFIPKDKGESKFTVLADYSRYSVENLDECKGDSIDAIRECFFKNERNDAIEACKVIKQKGYTLFIQPVDILGYSDIELIEFLNQVNTIEPYCLSIVDTFGSMYKEDLERVFEIINHNLTPTCRIGFHSHNNMQMSNALSQEFLRMTLGKREVVVDGTVAGMGRGAGNTPTELIAQYMVDKLHYSYDIDALLDIIDDYIENIRTKCSWGYSTPYFVAGCYSAHVNNVTYLKKKNSIRSKDIRYILNKIGAVPRKRYDYDLLEETYMEYVSSEVDDSNAIKRLSDVLADRNVVIVAPGISVQKQKEEIKSYISDKKAAVISINGIYDGIASDFAYVSNAKRYETFGKTLVESGIPVIVTSNIDNKYNAEYVISFKRLIKCGWIHVDNSGLMLLRLLDLFNVKSIAIAGLDGYGFSDNYAKGEMAFANSDENPIELNSEIQSMLTDYINTRKSECSISFITDTRFQI